MPASNIEGQFWRFAEFDAPPVQCLRQGSKARLQTLGIALDDSAAIDAALGEKDIEAVAKNSRRIRRAATSNW
jgi:hypothetical protein